MKKIFLILLLVIFCNGCSNDEAINKEQLNNYNNFKDNLINNIDKGNYNYPFNLSIDIDQINDQYSYTVIIDNPEIVMNKIQVMIINSNELETKNMLPNAGIIDETINMIPNQSDNKMNYPSGIALNGISDTDTFNVYGMITWYNEDNTVSNKTSFSFNVVNGAV